MSRLTRIVWVIVLLFFVSGCSTYRGVVLPGQLVTTQGEESVDPVVKKGMTIKVTLVNGTIITGDVIRVSELELEVGKVGNYGFEKQTIASSEIQTIEVEKHSRTEEIMAATIAITMAVGIVGFALLVYSLRGLGNLN